MPPPSSFAPSGSVVIFDDRNPFIQYDNDWDLGGTEDEFMGTVRVTGSKGAEAILSFNGVSIQVFGTFPAKNPSNATLAEFVVDNLPAQTLHQPANVTDDLFKQLLFEQKLDNGPHKLVITAKMSDSSTKLELDFIKINIFNANRKGGGGDIPHKNSASTTGLNSSSTRGSSQSTSSASASSRAQKESLPNVLPAVIGTTIGATIFLIGLFLGVYLLAKRRTLGRDQPNPSRRSPFNLRRRFAPKTPVDYSRSTFQFSSIMPSMISTGPSSLSYFNRSTYQRPPSFVAEKPPLMEPPPSAAFTEGKSTLSRESRAGKHLPGLPPHSESNLPTAQSHDRSSWNPT